MNATISLFLFSFYPFSLKLSIHPVKVNRHSSSRLAKFILQKKPQDFPEAFTKSSAVLSHDTIFFPM